MKYSEIILISFITYFYLVLLLRFLGKKEMSKLGILDLIVFLIISELMTLSIGDDKITFFHSALAAFVIVLVDKICSYVSIRYKPIKKLLEGHPTYIIDHGVINQEKMKALNYSVNDLCQHLRTQGIGSISDVEFAILEIDGNLSIIKKEDSHYLVPDSLINDGQINDDALKILNKSEKWLKELLKEEGIEDINDIFYCILEDEQLFIIKK